MHSYDFLQVKTDDALRLTGLLSRSREEKLAFILIHGFSTDFYTHTFLHTIAGNLKSKGISTLLPQTRGTGNHTEFLTDNNDGIYIGSFYEKLEDAHLDISAFIRELRSLGYENFVLGGHSLGTIKAVRYLFEGEYKEKIKGLVLLAPFDKNVFLEIKAPGMRDQFLARAKEKIDNGMGEEIVPVPEYEDFPMSYNTFVSWYNQSDLSNIWDFYRSDYKSPILAQISIPTIAILGEKDEFVTYPQFGVSATSALEKIKTSIKNCDTVLIPDSIHSFLNHESMVAESIAEFIARRVQ